MKRTTAGGIGILCAALAVGTGLFFQTGGIGHVTDHELYEKTGIPVESLPEEVQKELSEGKTVKDNMELYGFLENYSS